MKKLSIALMIITLFLISNLFANENRDELSKKISRFPVPTFEELPEDIQKTFKDFEKKLGFVPNVIRGMAHRPAELRAYLAYAKAVMQKKSGLTPAEKQMLIIAHSAYNGCIYCTVSHGASLRKITKNPQLSDQITVNYLEADINKREKAIIDFAMKVTREPATINEKDFEILHKHGLTKEDVWDIAAITSFFNMSNRMMSFTAIRTDDEFYKMGR